MTTRETKLITIREAAEMLGVHQETLRRWDNEGKLKAVRVGKVGHRKYNKEEVERLLRTS
jgi:DNA (cytosine-5)-methyltransferase 1